MRGGADDDIRVVIPLPARLAHVSQPTSRRPVRPQLRNICDADPIVVTQNLQVGGLPAGALSLRHPDVGVAAGRDTCKFRTPFRGPDVFLVLVKGEDSGQGPFGAGEIFNAVERHENTHHGVLGLLLGGHGVGSFEGEFVGEEGGVEELGVEDGEHSEGGDAVIEEGVGGGTKVEGHSGCSCSCI